MSRASGKFIQLSHLHKLRRCEQVAAVCYRFGPGGIEFLLVQTGRGRWTFPKGSTEPGLTHAQAAAIEAFEEAGVHGRIEEASCGRYACGSRYIHAHLCEVLRLETPREFGRTPTWFSVAAAKRRLRESRKPDEAKEISRIVDQAILRVGWQQNLQLRQRHLQAANRDPLQRVRLEAGTEVESTLLHYVRSEMKQPVVYGNRRALRGKLLQLSAPPMPDGDITATRESS